MIWLTHAATGSAATAFAVVGVASLGYLLLFGRSSLRDGARVIVGSFVLFGAPVIAAALMAFAEQAEGGKVLVLPVPLEQRPDLPTSDYDPYSGASLRSD